MSTAQNLLIGYGVLVLAYGFLLGVPIALVRMKTADVSRHLITTHLSGLMQGPIHFGLAFALGAVSFDSDLATGAAALIVAGSLAETAGGTLNWIQGTGDQFRERSMGFRVNSLTGLLAIPGVLIIVIGVLGRLS
jgi:hypothetical protein